MDLASSGFMTYRHAVLWIDKQEAKIFRSEGETFSAPTIERPHHHVHRHPQHTAERSNTTEEQHYYHEVARALEGAQGILVVGPATAKLEFIKHVHKHDHALTPKIVGVETVDHPTDGQLVAYARRYFEAADRMR